jgi:hypothetical protein
VTPKLDGERRIIFVETLTLCHEWQAAKPLPNIWIAKFDIPRFTNCSTLRSKATPSCLAVTGLTARLVFTLTPRSAIHFNRGTRSYSRLLTGGAADCRQAQASLTKKVKGDGDRAVGPYYGTFARLKSHVLRPQQGWGLLRTQNHGCEIAVVVCLNTNTAVLRPMPSVSQSTACIARSSQTPGLPVSLAAHQGDKKHKNRRLLCGFA